MNFDSFNWRVNGFYSQISTNLHGDMYFSRTCCDTPVTTEATLFGTETLFAPTVDTNEESHRSAGFTSYQDGTAVLLSLLYFAEHFGLESFSEIRDWREIERTCGVRHTNTAEAMFGSGDSMEFELQLLPLDADTYKQIEDKTFRGYPIVSQGPGNTPLVMPYLDREKSELSFLRAAKTGPFSIPNFPQLGNFEPLFCYQKEDIPFAIRGMIKLFARDRSRMRVLFEMFDATTPDTRLKWIEERSRARWGSR